MVASPVPSRPSPIQSPVPSPQASPTTAFELFLLLFVVNLTLQPLVEPDLGWHLRAGLDLIGQGGTPPDTDPYSHTMPEWRWVDHAWLTDGLLGVIYRTLGSYGGLGLILLFGALTASAFWIGTATVKAPRAARLLAIVCGLWVALPYLGARTQLVSLFGVATVFWMWKQIQEGRDSVLWAFPPLFLIWGNLHGGFTAGLFLLGLVTTISCVMRILVDRGLVRPEALGEPVPGWSMIRRLGLVAGAAAAVTLINPYGWRLHAEIYDSLMDRYMLENLREWQPVSFQGWAGKAYLLYLAGLVTLIAGWYRRVEPVWWGLITVFLWLSLVHWRNVTLFLVVSVPLTAELLVTAGAALIQRMPDTSRAVRMGIFALTVGAGGSLALLGADHLAHVWRSGTATESFFEQTEYPIEAVRWVRAHPDRVGTRLYNDYGLGGFLVWWLPEHKIFIDGRMPTWRLGDRRIFRDYLQLNQGDAEGLRVLEKYRIDWAVVTKDTPLAQALAAKPEWTALYRDAKVLVLRKEL